MGGYTIPISQGLPMLTGILPIVFFVSPVFFGKDIWINKSIFGYNIHAFGHVFGVCFCSQAVARLSLKLMLEKLSEFQTLLLNMHASILQAIVRKHICETALTLAIPKGSIDPILTGFIFELKETCQDFDNEPEFLMGFQTCLLSF